MTDITAKVLSSNAIAVLGQLFVVGPTWDGNIVIKAGRDELIQLGYVARTNSFAYLTEAGVVLASEWTNFGNCGGDNCLGAHWRRKAGHN